jgi:hypothetical protein
MCVDSTSSREEINVDMMRVLHAHQILGFFFISLFFYLVFYFLFFSLLFLGVFPFKRVFIILNSILFIYLFHFCVFYFHVCFFSIFLINIFVSMFICGFIILIFCVYFVIPCPPLLLLSSSTINHKLETKLYILFVMHCD